MTTKPGKPSFRRVLLITALGFGIGLALGIAMHLYGLGSEDASSSFTVNTTDRFGSPGSVRGHIHPAFISFPIVGAFIAFAWMLFLRAGRDE